MMERWGRGVVLGGITISMVVAFGGQPAQAQTPTQELPEIVVNAPSPIVRARPRPAAPRVVTAPAPAAPEAAPVPAAPAEPPPGWLPIVADQFATVTVVSREELQRSGGGTLGDVLFAKP